MTTMLGKKPIDSTQRRKPVEGFVRPEPMLHSRSAVRVRQTPERSSWMMRIRNGKLLPLQATLVLGLLFLIPSFRWPLHAPQGVEETEASTTVPGFREEDLQAAVLADIINDYKTFLTEEEKARLPGQIVAAAKQHGYDPYFVAGLIETESSFNNVAVSPAGARGLLQLTPGTAAELADELGVPWKGSKSLHDPGTNLRLGLYYLQKLESRFGNLDLALAAYNMGPSLLDQKMSDGFRPRGSYAAKVNAAYKDYLSRAHRTRTRVVAMVNL